MLSKRPFIFLLLLFSSLLYSHSDYSEAVKIKKIYPMGKKIYDKKCTNIDVLKYKNIDELRNSIRKDSLCKHLPLKYLEAVSMYLWDVKRVSKSEKEYKELAITKKDRCPVCGMFVYKYPRWIAQIAYNDKHYSFDGPKDMMKYYFKHKKGVKEILVKDYYTQKVIDGSRAYYVFGSNVYGAMGSEFIPFKDIKEAKTFYMDHGGVKILKFSEITPDKVYE